MLGVAQLHGLQHEQPRLWARTVRVGTGTVHVDGSGRCGHKQARVREGPGWGAPGVTYMRRDNSSWAQQQ